MPGLLLPLNAPAGSAPCPAWLISIGALLTAGLCADSYPDDFGPLLPDGVLDWTANTVVEFNVPASLPNGQVVIAAADHQYPVNLNSVVWAYGGDGGVLGNVPPSTLVDCTTAVPRLVREGAIPRAELRRRVGRLAP